MNEKTISLRAPRSSPTGFWVVSSSRVIAAVGPKGGGSTIHAPGFPAGGCSP